jgi:hypothetical protein
MLFQALIIFHHHHQKIIRSVTKMFNFFKKKRNFIVTIWFKDGKNRSFEYSAVSPQVAKNEVTRINRYANMYNVSVEIA